MNSDDWLEIVGAIGLFALVVTLIAVTLTQLGAYWRTRATLAREKEFRALAEKAVAGQENLERQLTTINHQLTAISDRMDSIERILKDVE